MGVANIQEDPLCPACGEQEETSFHFLGECCPNMQIRYSTFEAHLMQPSTLLWFLRARCTHLTKWLTVWLTIWLSACALQEALTVG